MQQKTKNKLSLTKRRRKNLTYAYNNDEKLPKVDFFYADMQKTVARKKFRAYLMSRKILRYLQDIFYA